MSVDEIEGVQSEQLIYVGSGLAAHYDLVLSIRHHDDLGSQFLCGQDLGHGLGV